MDPVTGAVIIVGLHKAGKPAAELVTNLLERMLGPAADAAGEIAAHPLKEFHRRRVKQAEQVVFTAANMVAESGLEPQEVPGRVLWPILEQGSLEDDTDLAIRWAAMLASAAVEPTRIPPAFPKILSELSPLDVQILVARASVLPADDYLKDGSVLRLHLGLLPAKLRDVPMRDVLISVSNLLRLRLAAMMGDVDTVPKLEDLPNVMFRLTTFGIAFVNACTPPGKRTLPSSYDWRG